MELFTDIIELRGSVNMVRKFLENSELKILVLAFLKNAIEI